MLILQQDIITELYYSNETQLRALVVRSSLTMTTVSEFDCGLTAPRVTVTIIYNRPALSMTTPIIRETPCGIL